MHRDSGGAGRGLGVFHHTRPLQEPLDQVGEVSVSPFDSDLPPLNGFYESLSLGFDPDLGLTGPGTHRTGVGKRDAARA